MWVINIHFPHWRHLFTDWKSGAEDEWPLPASLPQVYGRGETQAKWCSLIVSWYCCFWAGAEWQKHFSSIWSSQKSRSCNMLWSLWTRRNTSQMMFSEINFGLSDFEPRNRCVIFPSESSWCQKHSVISQRYEVVKNVEIVVCCDAVCLTKL